MADHNGESYSVIRKILPYTTATVIIVALYVGYIVFTRWQERRDLAEQTTQQQVTDARKTLEQYGSGQVKIMSFSVSPGLVEKGGKASLCYGVSNAKTVSIEPKPNENVWPSVARCVEASPKKTTTYTLTAQDANGHTETQDVVLTVQ